MKLLHSLQFLQGFREGGPAFESKMAGAICVDKSAVAKIFGHCFKFYNYFLPGFLEGGASNFNPARLLIKMLDQRTQ